MLKIIFGGSPMASAKALNLILEDSVNSRGSEEEYEVAGLLTNPPSAKGRNKTPTPTDAACALEQWNAAHGTNIPVFTPEHIKQEERDALKQTESELFVCFAYGHILGPKFFELFKYGGINLHPSLLPKYRGATPVNSAILNMDSETGVTVQKMSLAMDEGDILFQEKVPLNFTETADELLDSAAETGAKALMNIIRYVAKNKALPEATPQMGEATYCTIIKKEDGIINWNESARCIDAKIRAYTPWPGASTTFKGTQLKILKAKSVLAEEIPFENDSSVPNGTVVNYSKSQGYFVKTGDGYLCITELQLQSKKAMDYKSFNNGVRDFTGSQLV